MCHRCWKAPRGDNLVACTSCKLISCHRCAHAIRYEISEQMSLNIAAHDAMGKHEWAETPEKHAFCDKCNAQPAFDCPCGARRCQKCQRHVLSVFGPKTTWQKHPLRPLAFSVVDQRKIPEQQKLEWIQQELGPVAEMVEFSQKWLELFGNLVHGVIPQKHACIRLYNQYCETFGIKCLWRIESDIPPDVREGFQRLWHQTHTLCMECGSRVPRNGKLFCSAKCETAGIKMVCRKCEAPFDTLWPYCATCRVGFPTRPVLRDGNTAEDKACNKTANIYALAQKYWASNFTRDPNHEPEWKRRRRS